MPRARNIKPSFFTNEILGTLDPIISLLFAGLWCLADKDGILEDRPLRIKAELFPYRENLDINGYLTVLERTGFIVRYEAGENRFIAVLNFTKHQHPHHTEKSKGFPQPPEKKSKQVLTPLNNGDTPSDLLIPDSLIPDSKNTLPKGNEGKPNGFPKCPVDQIIQIYHEVLPTNPIVRVRTPNREKNIRARWQQFYQEGDFKDLAEGIECFRWFFEKVKSSKFLTGQTDKPFKADLEWLTKASNFAKVVEGRYE